MDVVRVIVASCLVCCCEMGTDELVDVALGTNYAQDYIRPSTTKKIVVTKTPLTTLSGE